MEIDDDSLKRSLCRAQVARKIDALALQIELKISFIVLDCLSKTHSSRSLNEVIMAVFKYFKKVEHTVSKRAQASGSKEVEENKAQKQLQSISELQPKKKRERYGNYDKIQRTEFAKWGIVHAVRFAARKFGVPESAARGIRTLKKLKLKMKNSENFQERMVTRKSFFHPS